MDSPILHNQTKHNKMQNDLLRMKNENIMKADPKTLKLQFFKQDSENQDPGNSETSRKASQRPGVSRLPVLAKSLHLKTPSDFTQAHCRWEEKPLAGKAKKKKPCPRPVPFNLSQPKSSRAATEIQQPSNVLQLRTGPSAVRVGKNVCKKQNLNATPSKHLAVVSSTSASAKGTLKSHEKNTENTIHPSGQSGLRNTFKPSTTLSNLLSPMPNKTMHHSRASPSAQPSVSAENCFTNQNPVRTKDQTKTSHTSQNLQLATQAKVLGSSKQDKGENFQPDHAALLSILHNEGVSALALGPGTPQSKPYNYLPQRVSVMKSQQKAGRVTASLKSVQFSPDAAALQSILQNEGVRAAGPVGATPRNSVCPSGRGTSVYTAQRVPVKKNREELAAVPLASAIKDNKWTPQRVRDTRHQPMSAMKWQLSTQPSPYVGTPGLKSFKTNLQPSREQEVVQRLFDDQEDEPTTNVTAKDPKTQAEQLPAQNSVTATHGEENNETSRPKISKDAEEEQEHRAEAGQPFGQTPGRASVICFSAKKMFRAPCLEKQESSSCQDQQGPDSLEQRTSSRLPKDFLSAGGLTCQIKPAVQSLHRDLILQKSCALNPAVALLRKRLPPLEDLRMDEEVASYTSLSVPAGSRFLPIRPSCGNPLAAILHFEESTTFVPIPFDPSSGPSSPLSLTLHEG